MSAHLNPSVASAVLAQDATLQSGSKLPLPVREPIAGFAAFLLAGPGSMALALFVCLALYKIGGGASTTVWTSAALLAVSAFATALGTALWAAQVRGEWGVRA